MSDQAETVMSWLFERGASGKIELAFVERARLRAISAEKLATVDRAGVFKLCNWEWGSAIQLSGSLCPIYVDRTGLEAQLAHIINVPAKNAGDQQAALGDSVTATTTAAMVKHATDHVAALLRNSPNLTKKDAFTSVRKAIGHVSDNQLKITVWPDARQAAGLNRKATPGPKRKADS